MNEPRPSNRIPNLNLVKVRKALYMAEQALGEAVNDLRNGYVYNGVDNNLAGDVLDQARQLVTRTKHRLIGD